MVDEQQHPGPECLQRRIHFGEPPAGCRDLLYLAAIHGLDEGISCWKMAVERSRTYTSLPGDLIQARVGSMAGEGAFSDFQDAPPVAVRIGARLPWLGV